MKLTGE